MNVYGTFVLEVFIVSLHYSSSHHQTVERKWPETSGGGLKLIRKAVCGLTVDISEQIKVIKIEPPI